jgi:hypothetical protein
MPHLPLAHHETSKHDSPNETKIKEKQTNRPEFEFKPRQVNDSSQSNQANTILSGFSISPLMSPLTTKAQSLKFESKTPWSTAKDQKNMEKLKKVI